MFARPICQECGEEMVCMSGNTLKGDGRLKLVYECPEDGSSTITYPTASDIEAMHEREGLQLEDAITGEKIEGICGLLSGWED